MGLQGGVKRAKIEEEEEEEEKNKIQVEFAGKGSAGLPGQVPRTDG